VRGSRAAGPSFTVELGAARAACPGAPGPPAGAAARLPRAFRVFL